MLKGCFRIFFLSTKETSRYLTMVFYLPFFNTRTQCGIWMIVQRAKSYLGMNLCILQGLCAAVNNKTIPWDEIYFLTCILEHEKDKWYPGGWWQDNLKVSHSDNTRCSFKCLTWWGVCIFSSYSCISRWELLTNKRERFLLSWQ